MTACRVDDRRDSLGRKLNKKRLSFSITVSCLGDIAPSQVIHTSGVSRCMRTAGVTSKAIWYSRHKLRYYFNKKAWQNATTFEDYFTETAKYLAIHHKTGNCILIIDNASSHGISRVIDISNPRLGINNFKLYLVFFPPNVTALIQPVDQCLGALAKRQYKKLVNRKRVNDIDYKPSPYEAILMFNECINRLTRESIVNAWKPCLGGLPGRAGVVLSIDVENHDNSPRTTDIDIPHDELHQPGSDITTGDAAYEAPPANRYQCPNCDKVFWLGTYEDAELIQFCNFCGSNIE